MPLTSIIIPVFNEEKFIERCLQSIENLETTEFKYEVLILDNGSTDRTHEIIRKCGFHFHSFPGLRIGALRNQGARMAMGPFLAFVDSDVELSASWLVKGVSGLQQFGAVAIAGPRCLPEHPTWVQEVWDIPRRKRHSCSDITQVQWHPTMALLVRKKEFFQVSGFNEQLVTAEDVDLGYRLKKTGDILFDPAMEAVHLGEDPDLNTFWRKEVWRGMGNFQGILSHGLRWEELPSLGYPLYMFIFALFLIIAIGIDLRWQTLVFSPAVMVALIFPALVLALSVAYRSHRFDAVFQLFFLYLVYGIARAMSILKMFGRGTKR